MSLVQFSEAKKIKIFFGDIIGYITLQGDYRMSLLNFSEAKLQPTVLIGEVIGYTGFLLR